MIQASRKYLKEEFKALVSTDMVKVDGRVLPAPKLSLGSQDKPVVPRDGAWDMRNKSLYEGARILTWALACFAPSRWCNDGHLSSFCKQMASVASREGMKMIETPTVITYAKGHSDVRCSLSSLLRSFLFLFILLVNHSFIYPLIHPFIHSVIHCHFWTVVRQLHLAWIVFNPPLTTP